jgi:hypothetical protein
MRKEEGHCGRDCEACWKLIVGGKMQVSGNLFEDLIAEAERERHSGIPGGCGMEGTMEEEWGQSSALFMRFWECGVSCVPNELGK